MANGCFYKVVQVFARNGGSKAMFEEIMEKEEEKEMFYANYDIFINIFESEEKARKCYFETLAS